MASLNLPLWLRFVLLVGIVGLASGASLLAYRYYTRPTTLSVAVGSIDGEAARSSTAVRRSKRPIPLRKARRILRWFVATSVTCRKRGPSSS
jgi:hypothetical protein